MDSGRVEKTELTFKLPAGLWTLTTTFTGWTDTAGLMMPLVKRSLPDFRPIFERYANDLKHEAERANGAGP